MKTKQIVLYALSLAAEMMMASLFLGVLYYFYSATGESLDGRSFWIAYNVSFWTYQSLLAFFWLHTALVCRKLSPASAGLTALPLAIYFFTNFSVQTSLIVLTLIAWAAIYQTFIVRIRYRANRYVRS